MTNNTDIIARIEALEKKNKQLRIMLFSVVGIFLAAGLVAFQTGPQFFKEIKTEKLSIVDSKGNNRMIFDIDTFNEAGFSIFSSDSEEGYNEISVPNSKWL